MAAAVKPILFNTEMVRAILEGRKTQTRRVVKSAPLGLRYEDGCPARNPPYKPGDVLWVRETWKQETHDYSGSGYATDGYLYRADEPQDTTGMMVEDRWHPSIHMPKKAARLFLRVTGVRCERLRDITARDAFNEGTGKLFLEDIAYGDKDYECDLDDEYGMAREQFAWLWESTLRKNDLERYGWWANPWVWVIVFERCERWG